MITLNEAQQAAVSTPDGPALVLAGAGSGKTRVIVERMAYLVNERGVNPRQLLALTFTNKAAGEIRRRFAERIEAEYVSSFLGTFHSFGLWLLRREMSVLDRKKDFVIYDDTDQLSLVKRLIKELPKRFAPVTPRAALGYISGVKQVEPFPEWSEDPDSKHEETCRELWHQYHDTLKRCNAVDFDDLTALTAHVLEHFPEVRDRYRERFRYVLIDEYQDTNRSQYVVARCLGENGNLFVVGDEDQSIYSWRGADIRNILDFVKDFPNAHVYRLEENYRSTQTILNASNAVVAHNHDRLGKRLFTRIEGGDPVRHFFADDGQTEAAFVAEDLQRRGIAPGQVAIFYRTHTLSRLMEEALRLKRIPYVVVGGIKFYNRKEIKDVLAYLRLVVNPADDESLRRILNVPPRGIGETSRSRITEYAASRRLPLLEVLRECDLDQSLGARARQSAADLVEVIETLKQESKSTPVAALVEDLLERIKYRQYVEEADEKESRNRIEVVNELVVACEQYDARSKDGLAGYLEELALVSDVDDWADAGNAATMMTCHCAKGLEFDHVYIIGMEDEQFPLMRFDESPDLEEERRLCYVAMTRACKSLTLTAADHRIVYGVSNSGRKPSIFLSEIGKERLQRVDKTGKPIGAKKADAKPVIKKMTESTDGNAFTTGAVVRHARFGRGVILYAKGSGAKLQVRVRFDSGRLALLMVAQAPLVLEKGAR